MPFCRPPAAGPACGRDARGFSVVLSRRVSTMSEPNAPGLAGHRQDQFLQVLSPDDAEAAFMAALCPQPSGAGEVARAALPGRGRAAGRAGDGGAQSGDRIAGRAGGAGASGMRYRSDPPVRSGNRPLQHALPWRGHAADPRPAAEALDPGFLPVAEAHHDFALRQDPRDAAALAAFGAARAQSRQDLRALGLDPRGGARLLTIRRALA